MVSRRQLLHSLGTSSALLATAGCLDGDSSGTTPRTHSTTHPTDETPTPTDEPTDTETSSLPDPLADAPVRTPGDVPEWSPEWKRSFDDWRVLGVDVGREDAGPTLYVTLERGHDEESTAVAALDPEAQSELWRTEVAGDAVGGAHAGARPNGRNQWGVTLADESVYTVTGQLERNEWSAVHALERAGGDRRWSMKRTRELAVRGVIDDYLVVTGLEFFPAEGTPPPTHVTPDEPLETVVYGVDAPTGEVRWTREFAGVDAVDVGAGGVYVAASDRLVGLTAEGETTFERGTGPVGRLEAVDDGVFVLAGPGADVAADEDATLFRFDPDGEAVWSREFPVSELLVDPESERLYLGGDAVFGVDFDGDVAWYDDTYGRWLLLDPGRDALYTRTGERADAAGAYGVEGTGEKRWTFDPPSTNAWPEAATDDSLVVSAITADDADDLFLTVYTVDADGRATAARGLDQVMATATHEGTVFLADGESTLHALSP